VTGRPSCSPPTTWNEADQLCNRLAIIDHGKLLALGTPQELKDATGIDSQVLVTVAGDPAPVAAMLGAEVEGATEANVVDGKIVLGVKGAKGVLPEVVQLAVKHGLRRHRPLGHGADSRDRVHQAHREGPARMTTVDTPTSGPEAAFESESRASGRSAFRALLIRDAYVLSHNLKEFPPPDPDPAVPARVRLHLRAAQDRSGHRWRSDQPGRGRRLHGVTDRPA